MADRSDQRPGRSSQEVHVNYRDVPSSTKKAVPHMRTKLARFVNTPNARA
jgi:hypothetical protein